MEGELRECAPETRISYHAVRRYVQRVLDIHVQTEPEANERQRAVAFCRAAGTTIDDLRRRMMTPGVLLAINSGFTQFTADGVIFFVSQPNGVVATVALADPRDTSKLKIRTEREIRRKKQQIDRRRQSKSKLYRQKYGDDA